MVVCLCFPGGRTVTVALCRLLARQDERTHVMSRLYLHVIIFSSLVGFFFFFFWLLLLLLLLEAGCLVLVVVVVVLFLFYICIHLLFHAVPPPFRLDASMCVCVCSLFLC